MDVTRVVFYTRARNKKSLAECSVIIDDELRLNDILLFKGESGYFLVFPSHQDVHQEVKLLNPDTEIVFPKNSLEGTNRKKKYEEFFHPLNKDLYQKILNAVVSTYEASHPAEKQ